MCQANSNFAALPSPGLDPVLFSNGIFSPAALNHMFNTCANSSIQMLNQLLQIQVTDLCTSSQTSRAVALLISASRQSSHLSYPLKPKVHEEAQVFIGLMPSIGRFGPSHLGAF